jgi:hypothetical protein
MKLYGVGRTRLFGVVGFQNGDRLVSICGDPVGVLERIARPLSELPAGCVIEIVRRGEPISLDITDTCSQLEPR